MRRISRPPHVLDWFLIALLFLAGLAFTYLAQMAWLPVDQFVVGALLTLAILAMRTAYLRKRFLDPGSPLRLMVLITCAFVVLRYILWRMQYTIPALHEGILDFAFGWLLIVAELIAIGIFFLGAFVNLHPLRREPVPLPEDRSRWPSVDIMVPSYNEDASLLEVTLLAAQNIRYPKDRLNIYLLDDGGTLQKRQDSDPARAEAALRRHIELKNLCQRLGVHYLTRERNEHAKAGNLNAALKKTSGELVLFLDADHVPTVDILENLAGPFLRNPKLFLVQSPHFFLNPDPVEKNIETGDRFPGEYEMFYTHGQRGLDFWNASFFCGSAALFRRCYLEEVGGIAGDTITEDAETALTLHARGYDSAYIHRPMVAGLQPETFSSFIIQRVRWCQGMLQMLRLKNPLFIPGLSWNQRLGYLNSIFYWLFPIPRTIFLFAPSLYLLFGIAFVKLSFPNVLVYVIPYLLSVVLVSNFFYGKVRWFLVSELYETVQSLFSITVVIKTLIQPRGATFAVTPKGEKLDEEFISQMSWPFYIALAIALLSVLAAILRLMLYPEESGQTLVALSWEIFNLIMLAGALGVVLEKPQRRSEPRVRLDLPGKLILEDMALNVSVRDMSYQGAMLAIDDGSNAALRLCLDQPAKLAFSNPVTGHAVEIPIRIRNIRNQSRMLVGVRLEPESIELRREIVAAAFGDSERWRRMLIQRNHHVGILAGLRFVLSRSARYSLAHVKALLQKWRGSRPEQEAA